MEKEVVECLTAKTPKLDTQLKERVIPDMGAHLILDFVDIPTDKIDLDDMAIMDAFLTEVILSSKATIEGKLKKKFEPQGLSILYLLSESHFSIHTWPESNACAIDFYHCGEDAKERMQIAESLLCQRMGWTNCTATMLINRGKVNQYLLNDYEHSSQIFKNIKLIDRTKSEHQDLRVFESERMGRIMTSNNEILFTEEREDIYLNDMLRQVVSRHKPMAHLLVLGSGDMELVQHMVDKYPKIAKITMVELDPMIMKQKKKFFTLSEQLIQALQEGKLKVVLDHGVDYIRQAALDNALFDGVIIECNNTAANKGALYSPNFYTDIKSILRNGAAFSQFLGNDSDKALFEKNVRKAQFNEISFSYSYIPEYSSCVPIGTARKS